MLELTTPTVRSDQRLAAEFRPRKLEPWLARLPRTDSGTHAKWLYKALSAQNRIAIAAPVRLQLMELYVGPFQEFQASHVSDLRAIATIPLHPHYRGKQKAMLGLLEALATGYKIAVVDLVTQRRAHNRRANLALALQRAIYYIGRVILAASEVYIRSPAGSWRELHELYRCAENEGLCETPVQATDQSSGTRHVLESYLQILLLGASGPLSLLPGEARRLHELAPQWCQAMKMMRAEELLSRSELSETGSFHPGHFRIKLSSDLPPLPLSKLPPGSVEHENEVRVLRTLGVVRSMHDILTSLEDPFSRDAMEVELTMGIEPADTDLLRRVGRALGEVGIKRRSGRFPAEQPLEFTVGFESICEVCKDSLSHRMSPRPAPGVPEPGEDAGGEQFIDLAEPMLGVPIDGGAAADQEPLPRPPRRPQSCQAWADNESAGGLCLVVQRSMDLWVKVGDIGACRFSDSSRWQPAVVRWMRVGTREVKFGVQFLSPLAVPLTAVGPDAGDGPGRRSEPVTVPAIWLPESPSLKHPGSIVLPRRAQPYPSSLRLIDGDAWPLSVRLLDRVERTGAYEQFLASVDSVDSASHSSLSS